MKYPVLSNCGGPAHTHYFSTFSAVSKGHRHLLTVFTYPVNGNQSDDHVHSFQGVSSDAENHRHEFSGVTGPPIALPDGNHYHQVGGEIFLPIDHNHVGSIFTLDNALAHSHTYQAKTTGILGSYRSER
jgi:hypothetical protein